MEVDDRDESVIDRRKEIRETLHVHAQRLESWQAAEDEYENVVSKTTAALVPHM